jgi:hypothetical protein
MNLAKRCGVAVAVLAAVAAAGAAISAAPTIGSRAVLAQTSAANVLQISATQRSVKADGTVLESHRVEHLVDREGGRYRSTEYDTAGRASRDLSILRDRYVAYRPQAGSAIVRTAASSHDPFLRSVSRELWAFQDAVKEGRGTVVGETQMEGRRQVQVRASFAQSGDVIGTFDAATGMTTSSDLGGQVAARLEIGYNRIDSFDAASIPDSRFEVTVPDTSDLELYDALGAAGVEAPSYGVYWLDLSFAGLELKALERHRTQPRQSTTKAPATDRTYAIYGVPGDPTSGVLQVISQSSPIAAERALGRVVNAGVVAPGPPSRLASL